MIRRRPQNKRKVFSLVLRRMRTPLIVLIFAYAISVLGLVLIPGVDDQGQPWQMSFFHAFYFVSYMATTIGFGELPYEFTNGQRLWTTISIYFTVIAWLYAIGKILTLIQDSALQRALTENRFAINVNQIREPFYLVCGYGDTGSLVVKALDQRGLRAVALDIKQSRIDELLLDPLNQFVPGLCANAGTPDNLRAAGLESTYCTAVLALTNDDHTNLEIAINSKLLNPRVRVICRAESKSTQANMASFGTDHIINPFDAFAEQLSIALHSPEMHQVFEWLTRPPGTPLNGNGNPPHGKWILCGYGRFGKAMEQYLKYEGIPTTIVEADPVKTGCEGICVVGPGTEAVTLREANIEDAVGIVAGTDDDANNLSILMTAKDLKPNIYTVARQNRRSNAVIFEAANVDRVMQHSTILTLKILALVTAPLLSEFLRLARRKDNDWAAALIAELRKVSANLAPDIWTLSLDAGNACAIIEAIENRRDIRLGHIISDPGNREEQLDCLPLLLKRGNEFTLLPEVKEALQQGDLILFCGRHGTARVMRKTLINVNVLRYIETGETRPDGMVWRWLAK